MWEEEIIGLVCFLFMSYLLFALIKGLYKSVRQQKVEEAFMNLNQKNKIEGPPSIKDFIELENHLKELAEVSNKPKKEKKENNQESMYQ